MRRFAGGGGGSRSRKSDYGADRWGDVWAERAQGDSEDVTRRQVAESGFGICKMLWCGLHVVAVDCLS